MPEHLKDASKESEEFNSYLKGFVNSRLQENDVKSRKASREELKEKTKKLVSSIAVMLAG